MKILNESTIPPCGPKAAGRPKAAEAEARLHNLMHTAGMLFLQKGYSKVSLDMIAKEAHVAVRTIYVKFGGKAGLLHAILMAKRAQFFPDLEFMQRDTRPVREVVTEFALRFWDLFTAPEARSMQRMVIAEGKSNPELAETFFRVGPCLTRDMLHRFFAREDVRAQLHPDADPAMLPSMLINCVIGDGIHHFLFDRPAPVADGDQRGALLQRIEFFIRAALKNG
jgi:AcrR family transcriptional regulator